VIHYRTFRNSDPPGLVRVWNEALGGRGTIPLRSPTPFDYFILSKGYFDPDGLQVALDDSAIVGWSLAGFAPNPAHTQLDLSSGILCILGVLPSHRGQGIGRELLRRSETYLYQRGAMQLLAGPMAPLNPFTFGIYGGSQSPGFLESSETLGPFLLHHGYAVDQTVLVMQRHLDRPFNVIDGRFPALRKRFEVKSLPRGGTAHWYDECVNGPIEFLSFGVEEKVSGRQVGHARIWEMEPFGVHWNESIAGVVDVLIEESMRRQGVARLLLGNVLRFLHDQYFTMVETQVPSENAPVLELFRGLGFQQVDTGHRYRRQPHSSS
jgi:ribosomal protein S18 acetylase RimI-like enzyme